MNGGVSWLRSRQKTENYGKFNPINRFGYQIGAGLLVPLGHRVSLEWKLGWEARRRNYRYQIFNNTGQIIKEIDETNWLKEFSVGVGLKIIL
jgi:hypothetical protein